MMFDTGAGVRNPLFFIGVVENNIDQRLEGRVQVRAFGIHGTNRDIPTEDLPWATVLSGAYDPNNPVPALNSWVFGVFLDGRDAQRPMLLGLIPTQYAEPFDPEVTGWGVIPDRYMHQLAKGSRPRDFGQPQSSRIARGENIEESYVAAQEMSRVEDVEMAIRQDGEEPRRWSEPGSAYNAVYPFNRVIESMSGDSHIQIDDTPGSERVTIWHRSGSYVEIDSRGTTTHKATSDKYEVNDRNLHVYVGGRASLTVEGDYHVRVKGHKIEEIEGDYTQIVRGNHMISVAGQANINASEAVQMRAAQITIESNVSNMSLLSRKTISLTAFGFKVDPVTGGSEGISLKAPLGSINIHAPTRNVNIGAGLSLRLGAVGQVSILGGPVVAIDAGIISLANGLAATNPAYAFALNSPTAIQAELPEPPAKSVGVNDYVNLSSMGTVGIGSQDEDLQNFNATPGQRLRFTELENLARQSGFTPEESRIMAAIALAESSGRTDALNSNRTTGDLSYGLWQINMLGDLGPTRRLQFGITDNEALYDPNTNARAAFLVYRERQTITSSGDGFTAWSVYNNERYRQFLG
jgi:hypothetical protein